MQKTLLPQEILRLLEHKVFRCSWCAGDVHIDEHGKYEVHRVPNTLSGCPNSQIDVSDEELIAAVEIAVAHTVRQMAEYLSVIEAAQKAFNAHKHIEKVAQRWLTKTKRANKPAVYAWVSKIQNTKKPNSHTKG